MKNFIPLFALLLLLSACSKQETLNEETPLIIEQGFIPADQMPAELLPTAEELRAEQTTGDSRFCCGVTDVSLAATHLEADLYIGAAADRILVHHYEHPWNYIGSWVAYLNAGACGNLTAFVPIGDFPPQSYTSYVKTVLADNTTCGGARHFQWVQN